MQGWLLPDGVDTQAGIDQSNAIDMSKELFQLVAPAEPVVYPGGDLRILLIYVGAKDNIARSLLARDATVIRVPWFDDLARHASEADGIVIDNGPGNPKDLVDLIDQLKQIMASFNKPFSESVWGTRFWRWPQEQTPISFLIVTEASTNRWRTN